MVQEMEVLKREGLKPAKTTVLDRAHLAWELFTTYHAVESNRLEDLLADKHPDVRWFATEALSNLEGERKEELLISMVADTDPYVREAAIMQFYPQGSRALERAFPLMDEHAGKPGAHSLSILKGAIRLVVAMGDEEAAQRIVDFTKARVSALQAYPKAQVAIQLMHSFREDYIEQAIALLTEADEYGALAFAQEVALHDNTWIRHWGKVDQLLASRGFRKKIVPAILDLVHLVPDGDMTKVVQWLGVILDDDRMRKNLEKDQELAEQIFQFLASNKGHVDKHTRAMVGKAFCALPHPSAAVQALSMLGDPIANVRKVVAANLVSLKQGPMDRTVLKGLVERLKQERKQNVQKALMRTMVKTENIGAVRDALMDTFQSSGRKVKCSILQIVFRTPLFEPICALALKGESEKVRKRAMILKERLAEEE